MKTLNFTTNLNTPEAVAAVAQPLNDIEAIDGWNIDPDGPDFLLTLQTTDNRIGAQVVQAIVQAGYRAEPTADA